MTEPTTETNVPIITMEELRKLPAINYNNIQSTGAGAGNVPILTPEQQDIWDKVTNYIRYHLRNWLNEQAKEFNCSAEMILQILYERVFIYEQIVNKLIKLFPVV